MRASEFAKSTLAVWVGLWLVLPGCLCQLLAAFGIESPQHHPIDRPSAQGGGAALCVSPGGALGVLPLGCVCDELTPKIAEPTGETDRHGASHEPYLGLYALAGSANGGGRGVRADEIGSRAPPLWRPCPPGFAREFTGVFLI